MIDDVLSVYHLRKSGLHEMQAKVLVFLLKNDRFVSAKECSDSAGVFYPKVYEILRSLADKGFCAVQEKGVGVKKRKKFKRVSFEVLLERLHYYHNKEFNEAINYLKTNLRGY